MHKKLTVNDAIGEDREFKELYSCGICRKTVYQPIESNCGCKSGIFCTQCLMNL